jgi:hypothetical protein
MIMGGPFKGLRGQVDKVDTVDSSRERKPETGGARP